MPRRTVPADVAVRIDAVLAVMQRRRWTFDYKRMELVLEGNWRHGASVDELECTAYAPAPEWARNPAVALFANAASVIRFAPTGRAARDRAHDLERARIEREVAELLAPPTLEDVPAGDVERVEVRRAAHAVTKHKADCANRARLRKALREAYLAEIGKPDAFMRNQVALEYEREFGEPITTLGKAEPS